MSDIPADVMAISRTLTEAYRDRWEGVRAETKITDIWALEDDWHAEAIAKAIHDAVMAERETLEREHQDFRLQNDLEWKAKVDYAKGIDRWQSIETAPKNIQDPHLCYSPGNPRAHNEYARDPHFHIDGFSERWPRGRNQYPESPYTHWMPLPAAPKAEG